MISGKATYKCLAQQRLLRQLHHVLRWSGLQIACYWVPGILNPADPPSRWWKHGEAIQVDLQTGVCMQPTQFPLLATLRRVSQVPGLTYLPVSCITSNRLCLYIWPRFKPGYTLYQSRLVQLALSTD